MKVIVGDFMYVPIIIAYINSANDATLFIT